MGPWSLLLVVASASLAGTASLLALGGPRAIVGCRPRGGCASRLTGLVDAIAPLRSALRSEELSRRRSACLAELPVMIDVVTLGLSAGLSFDASLELYCARYDGGLADDLSEAMLSWRIGAQGRSEALQGLAEELGVAALGRFASAVSEALELGSPLSEVLVRQAQVIRDERRAQVEERIERVPVKMLVPLGTLIVPAMFLAILGPLLASAVAVG